MKVRLDENLGFYGGLVVVLIIAKWWIVPNMSCWDIIWGIIGGLIGW